MDTVLLRPLPFGEPGRLVLALEKKLPRLPMFTVAPGNFLTWQAQNRTFESLAAWRTAALT